MVGQFNYDSTSEENMPIGSNEFTEGGNIVRQAWFEFGLGDAEFGFTITHYGQTFGNWGHGRMVINYMIGTRETQRYLESSILLTPNVTASESIEKLVESLPTLMKPAARNAAQSLLLKPSFPEHPEQYRDVFSQDH